MIVGLTGGIGAGKSTVSRLLRALGATVIDVDAIGREVLEPGGQAESAVLAEFGPEVLGADGAINRAALAKVVFAEPQALKRLTSISHPAIDKVLTARLASLPSDTIAVLDMAVLAESELGRSDPRYSYTFVVTVEADREAREERAVTRGSDRTDVRRRMALQVTDEQRRALADEILTNNGTLEELSAQVDGLWARLQSLEARARGDEAAPSI